MITAFNSFSSRVRNICQMIAARARYWRRYVLAAIAVLVAVFVYIPDVLSSKTQDNIAVIGAQQNSGNYVVDMLQIDPVTKQVVDASTARNIRQLSDMHIWPETLHKQALLLASTNAVARSQSKPENYRLATVRTSGWNFGNADRSVVITQIDPALPSFLYNIIGAAIVFAYFAILTVGIISLLIEAGRSGNDTRKRKFAAGVASILILFYALDWFVF